MPASCAIRPNAPTRLGSSRAPVAKVGCGAAPWTGAGASDRDDRTRWAEEICRRAKRESGKSAALRAIRQRQPVGRMPVPSGKEGCARPRRSTCSSPISGRGALFDRPAIVATGAEYCFGMNSGARRAPTVRPEGPCRPPHLCRRASARRWWFRGGASTWPATRLASGVDDFHNWSGVAAETAAALPKIVQLGSAALLAGAR